MEPHIACHIRWTADCERMPFVFCYFWYIHYNIITRLVLEIWRSLDYQMCHLQDQWIKYFIMKIIKYCLEPFQSMLKSRDGSLDFWEGGGGAIFLYMLFSFARFFNAIFFCKIFSLVKDEIKFFGICRPPPPKKKNLMVRPLPCMSPNIQDGEQLNISNQNMSRNKADVKIL